MIPIIEKYYVVPNGATNLKLDFLYIQKLQQRLVDRCLTSEDTIMLVAILADLAKPVE